jgi:DNA-directed RNA polymerase subunit RPC12/RpoP
VIHAGTDLAGRRINHPALYRCTACELDWSYEVVQHIARCPTCGGGLLRGSRDELPDYSLASPRARRISARRSRSAGSASSGV